MNDLQKYKYKVEKDLVDRSLIEYEAGKITDNDLKAIASYVLNSLKNVKTKEDLVNFLRALSVKWPMFSGIASIEEGNYKDLVEDDVYSGVLALAENGKIEEAIKLSRTMTN